MKPRFSTFASVRQPQSCARVNADAATARSKVWGLVAGPRTTDCPSVGRRSGRPPVKWQEGMVRFMLQSYDWEGALQTCMEVLRRDPDHLGALETLAHAQWMGGRYKDVVNTTSRLLRLNPLEPGYRYTRGMAHMSQGDLALAADDFRIAMGQSKDPKFQSQVASALDAVNLWIEDRGGRATSVPTSTGSLVRRASGWLDSTLIH